VKYQTRRNISIQWEQLKTVIFWFLYFLETDLMFSGKKVNMFHSNIVQIYFNLFIGNFCTLQSFHLQKLKWNDTMHWEFVNIFCVAKDDAPPVKRIVLFRKTFSSLIWLVYDPILMLRCMYLIWTKQFHTNHGILNWNGILAGNLPFQTFDACNGDKSKQ
jgi:hypothetical protein